MLNFIITPIAGGIIGYFTNWLAIKMLFRPYKEQRFLFFKIPFTPGLIPKERHKLAKKIGVVTGDYILTKDTLSKYIETPENHKKIINAITKVKSSTLDDVIGMIAKENKQKVINRIESYLSDLLSKLNSSEKINTVTEKIPAVSDSIFKYLNENTELDNTLKELTVKLINENIGKLAGFFINGDKVYDNIKKSAAVYFSQEENQIVLVSKIQSLLDKVTEAENIAPVINKIVSYLLNMRIDTTLKQVSENSDEYILHLTERHIEKLYALITDSLDISQIVEEKISGFEMEMAEGIIISVVKKELAAITYLGGLLGFVIGLIPPLLQLLNLY